MSSRTGVGRRAEPSFEDEYGHPLGRRRFRMEWAQPSDRRAFMPPFDVYETEQHIVVKVEIAGVQEEDFSISLEGHILHITGARNDSRDKLAYQRMEIAYGEFRLDIGLPHAVDEAEIEASYERGFLSVSVPRRPQQRRIVVTDLGDS